MPESPEDRQTRAPKREEPTSTAEILVRAKRGDQLAQDALVRRHIKALMRQAHGRLPSKSRGMYDTEDLVQATFLRAFRNLGQIEPRERGYFLAYLRKIMNNLIRDAMRSAARRPHNEPMKDDLAAHQPSPTDVVALHEKLEAYHKALAGLSREQQEVVRLRMELGMSYQEIADAVGAASANAVRMQVTRAVAHVARQMSGVQGD